MWTENYHKGKVYMLMPVNEDIVDDVILGTGMHSWFDREGFISNNMRIGMRILDGKYTVAIMPGDWESACLVNEIIDARL